MNVTVRRSFETCARFFPTTRTLFFGRNGARLISRFEENPQSARTVVRSIFSLSRIRDHVPDSTFSFALRSRSTAARFRRGAVPAKEPKYEELVGALDKGISSETKKANEKYKYLPAIQDFEIHLKQCEVTFTKKFNDEEITVRPDFTDGTRESVPNGTEEQESKKMLGFTVQIKKHEKVLSVECCYPDSDDDPPFQLTEVGLHSGDFTDATYSVSVDTMDNRLRDQLLECLKERGVSNDFAHGMIYFLSSYGDKMYIDVLKRVKNFVQK